MFPKRQVCSSQAALWLWTVSRVRRLVLRSREGETKGFSRSVLLLANPCCRQSFEPAAPTQQLWRRRIPRTATRWIKMSNLRHPSCFLRKPRRRRRKRKTRIWYVDDDDDDVLLHLLLLSCLVLVKIQD